MTPAPKCLVCGRPYRLGLRKHDDGYCSADCRREGVSGRLKTCKGCGKSFSLANRGNFNRDYHTTECARKHMKPPAPKQETIDKELAWKREVRERAGYRCMFPHDEVPTVKCHGVLDAHHIKPKDLFPELKYDLENGLLVCRNSHQWIENGENHRRAEKLGLRITRKGSV